MEVRKSKEQIEHPRRKKGSNERPRKTNVEREDAQVVKKKQKRTVHREAKLTCLNTGVLKATATQQAKWQPLSKSTREHLEATVHWLLASILYKTTENHSEIEKHLNRLKKRLLNIFETLRVPVEKLSSWKNVHKILAKEKKMSVVIEEGLVELQNELDKVLQEAEFREKNIECFQNKLQELKSELAAEESAASKLFQRDIKDGLPLPDISKDSLKAPILQNELLKVKNEQLLKDLNTIQQSDEMKTVSAFLEHVYENTDF
ncbi:centromere protein Q isoform X2 [Sceloporus undulatus]|uniref:centromere protein Q isoform X2 n=1 Tax=Sceloporus undulatus TaxID=8520 RepID=UPI001C4C6DA5|nr:centromere protein Q isoform X2 [Sceloporus undulatus]